MAFYSKTKCNLAIQGTCTMGSLVYIALTIRT